jgi:hypothetical protein
MRVNPFLLGLCCLVELFSLEEYQSYDCGDGEVYCSAAFLNESQDNKLESSSFKADIN